MESTAGEFRTFSDGGVSPGANGDFPAGCLASAFRLLEVLREEARVLRRFAGEELLALVPRKEYLVSELEWELKSALEAEPDSFNASDPLKLLLDEIDKQNTSNKVFIEKSLLYWQDLLSIFSPPSYGPAGTPSGRPPCPAKGTAFRREI